MNTKRENTIVKESVLEDGTTFYSYESAKEKFEQIRGKKFTVPDTILLLLYSQPEKPIHGRVLLVKQIFLLIEEILNKNDVQDAKFVPYRYGMYSFIVGNAITNLEFSGYVERRGKKNTKLEQFRITDKGRKYISEVFMSLPRNSQKKIREKRKGWDQLGYDGILRLVYQKYPEFKKESRIRERYETIKWGRGTG